MNSNETKIFRWWSSHIPPHTAFWTANVIKDLHPKCKLIDVYDNGEDDPRHLSNIFRLQKLYKYGGLWLDHDVIPLTNLTTISKYPWTASLYGRREGAVMWFPEPEHPWLKLVLQAAENASFNLASPYRSGEHVLNLIDPQNKFDIGRESRVFPFDALGNRVYEVDKPIAVHMWASSNRNYERRRHAT